MSDRRGVLLPTRDDPLVAALSEGVGGPAGGRLWPGQSWWTPIRVLLVLSFLASALALAAKQDCREDGWSTPFQFVHACYSDVPSLYFGRGLADGHLPYVADLPPEQQVEYPVLTGAVMWLTAQFVPDSGDPGRRALWYFDVNLIFIAAAAAVAVAATARTAGRRPWDAAMLAIAPGYILAGTVNWDLWAVMLTALAMLAWARDRPLQAGVLLGLAIAMKFYPLVLLGPLFLVCLRAGRLADFARAAAATAAAWLAVNLPVMLAAYDGWARFYELSRERGAGFSSIWYVMVLKGVERAGDGSWLNRVSLVSFVACCLAVAALAMVAPRRPRFAQLAFLTLAAFLLTNKVYSPQYVVWLLPLAVLARPRWRDFLIWQVGEVVHFFGIWSYLSGYGAGGDPNRAIGADAYSLSVLAHIVSTLWLVAIVVRDVLEPEHDPIRADGSDDPSGGPVDGAPDAFAFPAGGARGTARSRTGACAAS